MKSKKTYLIVIIAFVLIGGAIFWSFKNSQKANAPVVEKSEETVSQGEIIYFYGATCPHCKQVAQFLEDNKIAGKVNFTKKEIYNSQANANEMKKKAVECGVSPSGMGVPFVYANGKCYMGTPDVIAFFKKAAGME